MSMTDRFDQTTDDGFIRNIDPQAARHQFNMSIGLVAVLALATLSAALTLRIEPVDASTAPSRMVVQAPQVMHVQQAARDLKRQPGG
jgi:hypothetical protein